MIELGGVAAGTAVSVLCMAATALVVMSIALSIVRRLLFICRPNEILIFSGRKHRLPDGTVVGYKVVRRGWAIRLPLLQTISRMDMRLFMVEVSVANAFCCSKTAFV